MTDQLPATPAAGADLARAKTKRRPIQTISDPYLSCNGKRGLWEYGKDKLQVDGETVVINSGSLQHGWVRWSHTPLKVFSNIVDDEPIAPDPAEGKDYNGNIVDVQSQAARAFRGTFADGDKEPFQFETNAMGGVRACEGLYDVILAKYEDKTPYYYPVIKLGIDSFPGKAGQVFFPLFEILHWVDINGVEEGEAAKLDAPDTKKEPEAPKKRRRKVA